MIIYAPNGNKRGTLKDDIFIRDDTPVQKVKGGVFIFLEPECILELKEKGCRSFDWELRDREARLKIPIETFALAQVVEIGGRKQHRFYIPNA